jgi:hypothetical protein
MSDEARKNPGERSAPPSEPGAADSRVACAGVAIDASIERAAAAARSFGVSADDATRAGDGDAAALPGVT